MGFANIQAWPLTLYHVCATIRCHFVSRQSTLPRSVLPAPHASSAHCPLCCSTNSAPHRYQARDSLQWYGGLYTGGVTVITAAKMAGKAVPHVAGIPLVVGGFMLANMADAAYGNKLMRVQREAEHIIAVCHSFRP